MGTDVDWQHELDSSFGTGHDLPPGHYVAAGRTAVRRRRAASVAIVASMVVGVGAATWATSPGPAPRGDAPVATSGPPPTTAAEDPGSKDDSKKDRRDVTPSMSVAEEFLGNPALLEDGKLKLSPLAGEVLERVPNPMGYTPDQGQSIAIRVMYEGREVYSIIAAFGVGEWSINTNDATGDFAGWVATNVRNQQTLDAANGVTPSSGGTNDQRWLVLDGSGNVSTARPGVVITEQRPGVDLGESFGAGATATGVVRLLVDGRSEFAAYRVIDGTLDVIPAGGTFDSMAAFIDWARGQYASGAGMR